MAELLGRAIRAELGWQGKSAAQLSREIHLNETQLSNRITGKTDFASGELLQIAKALGVPAWELMRRAEENQQQK